MSSTPDASAHAADLRIQAVPAYGLPLSALVDRVPLVQRVPGEVQTMGPGNGADRIVFFLKRLPCVCVAYIVVFSGASLNLSVFEQLL